MDFINITLDSLNINKPKWDRRDGSIDYPLLKANQARMNSALCHPPGTLLMLDARPIVVLDGGWFMDGKIFNKMADLTDHLFY